MSVENPTVPAGLKSFLGNREVVEILGRAVNLDRLPHALIFAGPAGVGKCTLALLLAQRLNCIAPGPDGACGSCSLCRKIRSVMLSRYLGCLSLKGDVPCGGCRNCRILADQHPDVRIIEPEKTTIGIDQVRELINEISYQPFEARFRVVILDPADKMRTEAHNSLLKTLEEPPSRTVIILVTTNPYLLLQTILSRCRLLRFGGIPQPLIENYLVKEKGLAVQEARLAAALSNGSLAAALSFDSERHQEAKTQALRFVDLLIRRGRFSEVSPLLASLGKDKNLQDIWLESVEVILQDVYFFQVAPERVNQKDLHSDLAALAKIASRAELVSIIDAFKEFRLALTRNINRQIALESIFLEHRLRAGPG